MIQSDVYFRWIVAVNNKSKLDWVKYLINKHKTRNNFSLHVSTFDTDQPVPALSVQIVDDVRLYIIDVTRGHHSANDPDQDLLSCDNDLIKHFIRYYDKYWSSTIPLKEGATIYADNLNQLSRRFNI